MTKTSVFAGIALAVLIVANASLGLAATAPVPHTPSGDLASPVGLKGFTVTTPALAGGPSATNYYAYYDGDGPNLPGLIRSYDDYSRYADARGVAAASYLDASVMPQITDDPALTAIYGEFDYMFAAG
jgi:hypothetical protein